MRGCLLSILVCAATGAGQPLPLDGLAHVGYGVRDLAKSDAYYTGILGLARAFTSSNGANFYKGNDDQFVEIAGGAADSPAQPFHIALQTPDIAAARRLLRAGGNAPSVPGKRRDIIELMIHTDTLNRQRIGSMHHINFEVFDIHAAHRFVLAHGAPLPPAFRPRVNAEDIWAFNLIDPDGARIEVQDLTK